jgi:Domain of Unknown Function (DUF1080)
MSVRLSCIGTLCLAATTGLVASFVDERVPDTGADGGWRQHEIRRPTAPAVESPSGLGFSSAPNDAVVLFDGKSLDAWRTPNGRPAAWKLRDGAMEVAPGAGAIRTKGEFGDVQLHMEWASPKPPDGRGQDRGNSGIFLMGRYELQVLDSYQAETYADGQAGAIYGQYPPLFNASRPPGEWQAYDVAFRRPRFDRQGKLLEPARVTLFHNGILVQNNEELLGATSWLRWVPYEAHADKAPIELQDHGHPVKFRNMWLRELPERPAPSPADLERPKVIRLADNVLDELTGEYVMGANARGPRIAVTRAEGRLFVKFPFLPKPLAIEPISPTTFLMPHTDGQFVFQRNDQGAATSARFKIGDGERELKKVER